MYTYHHQHCSNNNEHGKITTKISGLFINLTAAAVKMCHSRSQASTLLKTLFLINQCQLRWSLLLLLLLLVLWLLIRLLMFVLLLSVLLLLVFAEATVAAAPLTATRATRATRATEATAGAAGATRCKTQVCVRTGLSIGRPLDTLVPVSFSIGSRQCKYTAKKTEPDHQNHHKFASTRGTATTTTAGNFVSRKPSQSPLPSPSTSTTAPPSPLQHHKQHHHHFISLIGSNDPDFPRLHCSILCLALSALLLVADWLVGGFVGCCCCC